MKRARKEANPPQISEPDNGLIVVHDEEYGVTMPPNPDQIYAVINVKGQ